MNRMKEGWARTALVAAVAVGAMTGFCDAAVAKHGKNTRHAHRLARHLRKIPSTNSETAQLARPQPVGLGTMRYSGGPKSPMWRAPAEN
jgi:hypothetical protein